MEGAPLSLNAWCLLWEVPIYGKFPLMGSAVMGGTPLLEVLLCGRCSLMGGAPLWVPFMGGASLRKVLLSGRYTLWVVPLYEKCPIMEGTPLCEVPLYGRYPFMRIHERCSFIWDALMECVPL